MGNQAREARGDRTRAGGCAERTVGYNECSSGILGCGGLRQEDFFRKTPRFCAGAFSCASSVKRRPLGLKPIPANPFAALKGRSSTKPALRQETSPTFVIAAVPPRRLMVVVAGFKRG